VKKEDLFESLNDVKDAYVAEAGEQAPAAKRVHWARWGAVAACAAIAVFAGTRLGGPAGVAPTMPPAQSAQPTAPAATRRPGVGDLPLLEVADFSGAMGFEGYLAYSPEELVDRPPWDGEELDTLPVYKNQAPTDAAGAVTGDRSALEAQVREVAARLGITELTITDDVPTQEEIEKGMLPRSEPYAVTGRAEGVRITAFASQQVRVEFDPAWTLPDGTLIDESSDQALAAAGEQLKIVYAGLLDMAQPTVEVRGGDYTFRGERQDFQLYIYDAAGDLPERIAARDLKSAWFCADSGGELYIIWLDTYDLSEKTGDYPIITVQEATDLLCNGNYITTVPAEMPGEDKIVRTELIYRTERTAKYFMPYYRFLVEVDDPGVTSESAAALGLKTYGAYYVPAVAGEYLTELPVWDGSFNI